MFECSTVKSMTAVSLRYVGSLGLLALAASNASARDVDTREVSPIMAVPGETYLVEFSEKEGFVIDGKKGDKRFAHVFAFDLMSKEEISCYAQSTVKLEYVPAEQRTGRNKGPRHGWKEYGGKTVKANGKLNSCGFEGKVGDAGRYELTFLAEEPGSLRVHFFNKDAKPSKSEGLTILANAEAVSSTDPSRRVAVAKGPSIFLFPMPDGGTTWLQTKPETLRPYYSALLRDGEYNAVGNFSKLGAAAIATHDYAVAEWAFDHALNRIEAIYAEDEAAKAARSKFSQEAIKDFKGDPYERAMAYYYRGLLYLREGDFGNARASFASAEYQDTVSEFEQYQSDFALMNYLAGWSARCMGNEAIAEDAFAAAQAINPSLATPGAGHDTLIIGELGTGPVKMRRGKRSEMVTVVRSAGYVPADTPAPRLASGELIRAGDITHQATTRGGRHFDAILDGKVSFKNTTAAVGDAAMIGVSLLSDQLGSVGSVLGMFGGIGGKLLSGATKTEADVRYWDSLPDAVYLTTLSGGGMKPVSFEGIDGPGTTMSSDDGLTCAMSWTAAQSPMDAAAGIPGTPTKAPKWRDSKDETRLRDQLFRQALMAEEL